MASTVCAEIALRARVGKCPEGGLGLEWYARGAFVFDTAYITYASEKSTGESFSSHFQIPIRGSGSKRFTGVRRKEVAGSTGGRGLSVQVVRLLGPGYVLDGHGTKPLKPTRTSVNSRDSPPVTNRGNGPRAIS